MASRQAWSSQVQSGCSTFWFLFAWVKVMLRRSHETSEAPWILEPEPARLRRVYGFNINVVRVDVGDASHQVIQWLQVYEKEKRTPASTTASPRSSAEHLSASQKRARQKLLGQHLLLREIKSKDLPSSFPPCSAHADCDLVPWV